MIALAALMLAGAAPATEPPRAFLARLYARYEKGDLNPPVPETKIYTPELVREMDLNAKLHGPEEVGLIDYDPVCQCQDIAELKARIGDVSPAGAGRALARVTLRSQGSAPQVLDIRLARTPAGWRIADIGTAQQASLLTALRRDNARMRPRRH